MDNNEATPSAVLTQEEANQLFSGARLASFSESGDLDEALSVCTYEIELRAALIRPINITEIFLRNTLDHAICEWWKNQGLRGDWLDPGMKPDMPDFLKLFCSVEKWRKQTIRNCSSQKIPSEITHDDVIAHVMYGTWRNMIGDPLAIRKHGSLNIDSSRHGKEEIDRHSAKLWKEILHYAFPNIPSKSNRKRLSPRAYIGTRVAHIGALRNRVCHWDNLLQVNVNARYRDMQEIVSAISVPGLNWMKAQTEEPLQRFL